jgi:predicted nucleotidyltransferase
MGAAVETKVLDRDPTLREIVERLANAYRPLRIYLFGSHGRGNAVSDSDYDLLLVVSDDAPLQLKQSRLAHQKLWGIKKPVDVLVCTDKWFKSRERVVSSLAGIIRREGQLLYAA